MWESWESIATRRRGLVQRLPFRQPPLQIPDRLGDSEPHGMTFGVARLLELGGTLIGGLRCPALVLFQQESRSPPDVNLGNQCL